MKKILSSILFVLFLCPLLFSQSQNNSKNDKYSSVNVIVQTIWSTKMGIVVDYYLDGEILSAYIPNKYFDDKTVIRIYEDNSQISPQMNIIYKNLEPFRVKLYVPTNPYGPKYKVIEIMPNDLIDKFKNTTKLEFPMTKSSAVKSDNKQ